MEKQKTKKQWLAAEMLASAQRKEQKRTAGLVALPEFVGGNEDFVYETYREGDGIVVGILLEDEEGGTTVLRLPAVATNIQHWFKRHDYPQHNWYSLKASEFNKRQLEALEAFRIA